MKPKANKKADHAKGEKLDKSFVELVIDQIQSVGNISHKYMFGGCAIYRNKKVVALICNNQLYVRPTQAGKEFLGTVDEQSPYPGAKPHFLIENTDDGDGLRDLIRITDKELSSAKPGRR